ncbi:MAG: trypsin-like serine protease [Proteobacteria bacterium]|nr:trypsin-like serine protease [Pseudomonadota bacterium]MCP4915392.1 trypsin-like serine protease [Pseudomonadota bacterium]
MLLTVALAFAQDAPPIVGGSETSNYKSVGALVAVKGNSGGSFCSGTLVKAARVITAAHCNEAAEEYIDSGYDIYFVLDDEVYTSSWTTYELVSQVLIHPDYEYSSSNIEYDIGVLKLDSAITTIGTMRINTDNVKQTWLGETITYVGYGATSQDGGGEGVKRTVDVRLNDKDGDFIYTSTDEGKVENVCPGDSGGAALMLRDDGKYELVGVNSFVFSWSGGADYSCDKDTQSGAAAQRVDKALDWLENYMEIEYEEEEGDTDTDTDTDTDSDSDADTDSDTDADTDSGAGIPSDTAPNNDSGDSTSTFDPPDEGCQGCAGGPASAGLLAVWLAAAGLRRRRD